MGVNNYCKIKQTNKEFLMKVIILSICILLVPVSVTAQNCKGKRPLFCQGMQEGEEEDYRASLIKEKENYTDEEIEKQVAKYIKFQGEVDERMSRIRKKREAASVYKNDMKPKKSEWGYTNDGNAVFRTLNAGGFILIECFSKDGQGECINYDAPLMHRVN